jgi:spermidine dehydrogenase
VHRDLGLDRPITRRDFLNGVALAVGAALTPRGALAADDAIAPERDPGYYPPGLTGMRGSHDGSFEVAHRLKDGDFWAAAGAPEDTGERYDLVVVGAGISGLSAAWFFRRANPGARILLLDNHDDFGGHARRMELRSRGGRLVLGYGGTQSMESPSLYSAAAKGLLRDLGIDLDRFYTAFDRKLYASLGLQPAVFFDEETFGADRLVRGFGVRPLADVLAESPMPERLRRALVRLCDPETDYLPGLSVEEKRSRLAHISYADFLTKQASLPAEALPLFQAMTHDLYGVGIEAIPALDCWGNGFFIGGLGERIDYPGLGGLGLDRAAAPEMGRTAQLDRSQEPYIFHFPDGNASVARLLVRALVPKAAPGSTMEDVVTARFDYARLDEPGAPVRLRLDSTAVRVRHAGDVGASDVEVVYVRGGRLRRVRGGACVLACWNGVVPHLCPELPAVQKEALAYGVKVPLVYSHVLIRDWTSFRKLGVEQVYAPGGYHTTVSLDYPVSLGEYAFPREPEQPMMLHMVRTPCRPGLPPRDQHRAGRIELLGTPFETFERQIRDQLGRMLGGGGFDPARDVEAITVNRWSHGYAYEYNSLFDPDWREGQEPCVIGRRRFGRIAIANSDAGASAYTDSAIDQAHRAVGELVG